MKKDSMYSYNITNERPAHKKEVNKVGKAKDTISIWENAQQNIELDWVVNFTFDYEEFTILA